VLFSKVGNWERAFYEVVMEIRGGRMREGYEVSTMRSRVCSGRTCCARGVGLKTSQKRNGCIKTATASRSIASKGGIRLGRS
jgi:hypothetical protein